jgi:hypothetical protein
MFDGGRKDGTKPHHQSHPRHQEHIWRWMVNCTGTIYQRMHKMLRDSSCEPVQTAHSPAVNLTLCRHVIPAQFNGRTTTPTGTLSSKWWQDTQLLAEDIVSEQGTSAAVYVQRRICTKKSQEYCNCGLRQVHVPCALCIPRSRSRVHIACLPSGVFAEGGRMYGEVLATNALMPA